MNQEPLYNLEAELAILGGLMTEKPDRSEKLYDTVSQIISSDDFCEPKHQIIYQEICIQAENGNSFDIITLMDSLQAKQRFHGVDEILRQAVKFGLTYYGTIGQAKIIRQLAKARMVDRIGDEFRELARSGTDPDIILERAQQMISSAVSSSRKVRHISEVLRDVKEIIAARTSGGDIPGVSSGFFLMDRIIQSFAPGRLYVLGARPGMGKTALALNVAINVAKREKKVLFFSLEMPDTQLVERLVAQVSGVSGSSLNEDTSPDELERVTQSYGSLESLPLLFEDTSAIRPEEILAISRQEHRRSPLSMVIVDYAQLVQADGKENETLLVGKVTRMLKRLSKELEIPVVALSQLNRSVENRNNKRPQLSDLRQSGEIEQDADVVMFLYRDETYFDDSPFRGIAEVIFAKNRHGRMGIIPLEYRPDINLFSDSDIDLAAMKQEQKRSGLDDI